MISGTAAGPDGRSFIPLGLDISGWPCVVIGGGRVGARKAATLLRAGARVTVVSPEVSAAIAQGVARGELRWLRAAYAPEHLDGARLVVAATGDAILNLRIGREAEARALPCCVVSSGRASGVIFPAVHRGEGVTVAVHSDGRNCVRSRGLRDRIAGLIGADSARGALVGLCARRPECGESALRAAVAGAGGVPFVLATCRRREAYALGGAAHLARGASQWGFDLLSGPAAFHHLVRVAAGLDSPLRGEADVAEQLRAALAQQRGLLPAGLGEVLSAALRSQAAVRLASGLSADRRWAVEVVDALSARLAGLDGRVVALVGCGRLNAEIAGRLSSAGARVRPFSHRERVGWCARAGWAVNPLSALNSGARAAHAAVLGVALTGPEADDLAAALLPEAIVLDLSGANAGRFAARPGFIGVESFADGPPTGPEAARLACAEQGAYIETLAWWSRGLAGRGPASLRIGARRSRLSLAQAGEARGFIAALWPESAVEFIGFDAPGDRDKSTPLPDVAQEDFFTRDIDEAVRRGEIDAGLHSAKDLPRQPAPDLTVVGRTPCFAPWECLVTRDGRGLRELKPGARVGTSSARRAQRLRELRPELVPAEIRGNVPDRVAQLDAGRYDALVLAAAGLLRLRMEGRIAQVFTAAEFPPEPAQGSLAFVTRADRDDVIAALAPLGFAGRAP
jgi:hydroxymethylbilane synthase